MVNYNNGKIYKMISSNGKIYIGSTCQSLAKRKAKHKSNYADWKKGQYPWTTSFELFDDAIHDVDIVLLESVACESKEQLHARERHHIESAECVNKYVPLRTKKEYYEYCKPKLAVARQTDEYKQKQREYREQNNDKTKAWHKKWRDGNKEKIKEYRENSKDKMKQYIENNREKLKETWGAYREKNKEVIAQKKKENMACDCGSEIRKCTYARHVKTMKHKQWQEQQQQEQQQP
jgi:hypothetical protein